MIEKVGHVAERGVKKLFMGLSGHQKPRAVFVTCSGSRMDPPLLTQTEPGDLFIVRNAGN